MTSLIPFKKLNQSARLHIWEGFSPVCLAEVFRGAGGFHSVERFPVVQLLSGKQREQPLPEGWMPRKFGPVHKARPNEYENKLSFEQEDTAQNLLYYFIIL